MRCIQNSNLSNATCAGKCALADLDWFSFFFSPTLLELISCKCVIASNSQSNPTFNWYYCTICYRKRKSRKSSILPKKLEERFD